MAELTREQLIADANAFLPDNDDRAVSVGTVRQRIIDSANSHPTIGEFNGAVQDLSETLELGLARASIGSVTLPYISQVTNGASHLVVGLVGSGLIAPASSSNPDAWMGKVRGIAIGPLVASQTVSVTRSDKVTELLDCGLARFRR
jgi:hypothetical protein